MQESDKNIVYKCFEKLNDRIFEISNANLVESYHNPSLVIDWLRDNGIHGINPEDLIDEIIAIKARIEELKERMPSLVSKVEIKAVTEVDRVFDKTIDLVEPDLKRKEILDGLRAELDFYIVELDKHYEYALKRVSTDSSMLTNAGIKLKFNLNAKQIGTLFNGLHEANVIKLVDGITGKKIEKQDLANWISKNCSTNNKESISKTNVSNLLNNKEAQSITTHLKEVIKVINEIKI